MDNMLLMFLITLLLTFFHIYCWNKLLYQSKKIKFNLKNYIIVFICTLITYTCNYVFPQPFRIIIILLLMITVNFFLLSKNLKNAILLVVMSQMILAFAEFSFIIPCSIIFGNKIYELLYEPIPFILLNSYILIISGIIINQKFLYKLYNLFCNNNKNIENIIYPIIVIFTLIVATMESHMKIPLTLVLIINIIMAIVFISIIIASTKIKVNYNKISSKYETSISSLKEYEIMIDKFRVDTHENKNEFLTIRNMVKEDPNEAIKYIDTIVNNKIKDNYKIMKQTAKIPKGGLRATIYSKLCLMDKLKIKYTLNISRDVHTTDLIGLDEDLILKICKILGVFLDNAIEAVEDLKKKEIFIEIYIMDNYLCIDIINNFKGSINLEKISNMKYTTKEEGHGYGLTLVNKILSEETGRLENEKSINKNMFTQTLKIKM